VAYPARIFLHQSEYAGGRDKCVLFTFDTVSFLPAVKSMMRTMIKKAPDAANRRQIDDN
jgi:hypothetical protein